MVSNNSSQLSHKIIFLMVVVAGLIVSAVYLQSQPSVTWLTYRNEKFGIELKYPPTWHVEKITDSGFWINPPDFKMPVSGTVHPYFSFGITAHEYSGEEKPVIKMFGIRKGYVYEKERQVYFPSPRGAGGYVIVLYSPTGVSTPEEILSTLKFTNPTDSIVGRACGRGISGNQAACPSGYECLFPANHELGGLDGTCVKVP